MLLLLKCCFTSTETVGLLGMGAQDGHLDFHTAPELWRSRKEVGLIYLTVFCCRKSILSSSWFFNWSSYVIAVLSIQGGYEVKQSPFAQSGINIWSDSKHMASILYVCKKTNIAIFFDIMNVMHIKLLMFYPVIQLSVTLWTLFMYMMLVWLSLNVLFCVCSQQGNIDFLWMFPFVFVRNSIISFWFFSECNWVIINFTILNTGILLKKVLCHCSTTVASKSIFSHFLTRGMCYIVFHSFSICQNDTVYCCPQCTSSFQKWVCRTISVGGRKNKRKDLSAVFSLCDWQACK